MTSQNPNIPHTSQHQITEQHFSLAGRSYPTPPLGPCPSTSHFRLLFFKLLYYDLHIYFKGNHNVMVSKKQVSLHHHKVVATERTHNTYTTLVNSNKKTRGCLLLQRETGCCWRGISDAHHTETSLTPAGQSREELHPCFRYVYCWDHTQDEVACSQVSTTKQGQSVLQPNPPTNSLLTINTSEGKRPSPPKTKHSAREVGQFADRVLRAPKV